MTYKDNDNFILSRPVKEYIIRHAIIMKNDIYEEVLRIYIQKGVITQQEVFDYIRNWYKGK